MYCICLENLNKYRWKAEFNICFATSGLYTNSVPKKLPLPLQDAVKAMVCCVVPTVITCETHLNSLEITRYFSIVIKAALFEYCTPSASSVDF